MADRAMLARIAALAVDAGALIMRHYEAGIVGREKADFSPVTDADEEAEHLILERLMRLAPGVPIVSEEAAAAGRTPDTEHAFFLVDPLDGTKEFLARNGEFTVNIALIDEHRPIMGVVYAPAFARLFVGDANGALEASWPVHQPPGDVLDFGAALPIRVRPERKGHRVALWSRSHDKHRADEYRALYGIDAVKVLGSSLKFCAIAAGEADIYPRHGDTMAWDTAAGHAVLNAAGGSVRLQDGAELEYGRGRDFKNPWFIARGTP